jgi:argininosuccinate synthase
LEKAQYSINKDFGNKCWRKRNLTQPTTSNDAYPSTITKEGRNSTTFEKGELGGINMKSPIDNIVILEKLASATLMVDVMGDTIIGIKELVLKLLLVIIIKAHHLLEKHTLGKWQQYWKEQLGNWYG